MPRRRRILLVEDEHDIGQLLLVTLRSEGYRIDLVTTAEEAEAQLASRCAYDVVICDWLLDEGGDGMTIAARAADKGIPTIIMSGYLFRLAEPDKRHEYLMKPVRPHELITVIERLIDAENHR